jgi:2-dehydro-3-deoxy-D-arabinonate dehydratase
LYSARKEGPDTMYLSRHQASEGPRWALDGRYLPRDFTLERLLEVHANAVRGFVGGLARGDAAADPSLPPVEPGHEVWASGVTYLRSREAREIESADADAYERVYDAERPELFFKALGWRVVGHKGRVRVRGDSRWNVPEPELVLVVNSAMEIVGYTAGNDVSSRDIEGENPLYLPQAKVYDGSCSLGPGIMLSGPDSLRDLRVAMSVRRGDEVVFEDAVETSQMKRSPGELADFLGKELTLPGGALLMTGTGIVPEDDFTLKPGDVVEISVGDLVLENEVTQ